MTAKQDLFSDYRNAEGVNKSWLELMETSPLHFKENAPRPFSQAFDIGRLIHLCVLERDLFVSSTVVWEGGKTKPTKKDPEGRPTMNKNSQAYKDFAADAEANGKIVVDSDDIWICNRIRDAVYNHPVARNLLDVGKRETSIYWTHPLGVKMKSRIDHMGPTTVDLKSARDLTPRKFNRSILDYGYHTQGAMYSDAVEAETGEKRPYSIIAAEKVPPFDVVVYELDDMILDLGRQTYTRWLERYVECMMHDTWPGIGADPIKAELPAWAFDQMEDGTIYVDGVAV